MAARTTDRRVQRTRKLLQDALNTLMIEKGYEATTVQDIIDRANVGRSTFYSHFPDKETLLGSRIEDLRALLQQKQAEVRSATNESASRALGFSLPMFEHARGHLQLYLAIVGRESGAFVMRRIHDVIADVVHDDLQALGFNGSPGEPDLAAQYVAGAFMSVLTWWVERSAEPSPKDMDRIFRRLTLQGLATELA